MTQPTTTGRHRAAEVRRRLVVHAMDEAEKAARKEARANLRWLGWFIACVLVAGWSLEALIAWWAGS